MKYINNIFYDILKDFRHGIIYEKSNIETILNVNTVVFHKTINFSNVLNRAIRNSVDLQFYKKRN